MWFAMSRVEQIESDVRTLKPDELRAFRDWFLRFDAGVWDAQIEADIKSGKLKSMAERAIRDRESGRSKPL
jgi:hypothetical protein